jgi:hypothetical protein
MKFLRSVLLYAAGAALLVGLANVGVSFFALKRLEKKAQAPIQGTFLPDLLRPSFILKDPHLDWQGRFQVSSGTFYVEYDPLFLLPGRRFRTQIEGKDLSVRLLGELAESQGLTEVRIDRVEADLAFARKGPPEVFVFKVESPQLQFHLSERENAAESVKTVAPATVN